MELKFRDSLLALFLDRRGGMVVDFHFRFEPGEISLAEATRDACGRLRLETDTQLVVTLHEILRLGRFFAFAAGNSETRTDSSLEFAANVRMPDERRRAV